MLHPIEDNLDKYTNQELEAKYSELTKKFYMTRNPQVKNQMATLININGDKVYGNALITKTKLPLESKNMYFEDMTKEDLYKMLYNRANKKIVLYDIDSEEFRDERTILPIDQYADKYFEEDKYKVKKVELFFLKHNINIWYVVSDFGIENLCGKLIPGKIEKCIIFSRMNEVYLADLSLNEFKKIKYLSTVLTDFHAGEEHYSEETDELNRKVIKNRYRVLNIEYKKHIK